MALEEAKRMGLTLMDDPETLSNAPREHRHHNRLQRDDDRSKHLHDGAAALSDNDDDIDANDSDDAELVQYMLETGGLTDREIDRLDGKTSGRLHQKDKPSAAATEAESGAEGAGVTNKYLERDSGANTGPKGVLADQKYHRQQQLQERMAETQSYNARMESKAMTTTTFREDQTAETKSKKDLEKEHMTPEQRKMAEELEDDEDEKKILERIRGNRLKEMAFSAQTGKGGLLKRKTFGYLMEMNAAQYVAAIDSEKKDVTVVIHIYSDYNADCKKLDSSLITLAGQYASTKFIRIKAREVDFDEEVCPTVLVYRAGDLIANLVMVTYDLPADYTTSDVEELLTSHKCISPHDQCQRENSYEHGASLDPSNFFASSSTSAAGLGDDFDLMSLGLDVGSSNTSRRGILSGNVPQFRYQDYEDDDDHSDVDAPRY
ncbi:hypothetical protein EMPS_04894 [Entomortierella parvispora]|uniref:Phosducin domain-containing protein n=1 Tax=Entomortierella parvispora TaxID=205924 RepID=A0A9P3LVT9_9FUNG|nr:hypothetical protein EMPS_04894 [Entomortierella parvispora]